MQSCATKFPGRVLILIDTGGGDSTSVQLGYHNEEEREGRKRRRRGGDGQQAAQWLRYVSSLDGHVPIID